MTQRDQPLGVSGGIVVTLGTIFFLTATVWLSMIPISITIKAIQLRNAVLVDARILNIDKQWVSSGDGSREVITIRYEYDYFNKRYEHNTQDIALFGRNSTARLLEEELAAGNNIQCFVDPDDPALSVFSTEFSVGWFIFSVLFAGAFAGVSVICSVELCRRTRTFFRLRRQSKEVIT